MRWDLNPEGMNMYQIYSLLTIMAILFGITIWASLPEEEAVDGRNRSVTVADQVGPSP